MSKVNHSSYIMGCPPDQLAGFEAFTSAMFVLKVLQKFERCPPGRYLEL